MDFQSIAGAWWLAQADSNDNAYTLNLNSTSLLPYTSNTKTHGLALRVVCT